MLILRKMRKELKTGKIHLEEDLPGYRKTEKRMILKDYRKLNMG
jgi:hypothetical protein